MSNSSSRWWDKVLAHENTCLVIEISFWRLIVQWQLSETYSLVTDRKWLLCICPPGVLGFGLTVEQNHWGPRATVLKGPLVKDLPQINIPSHQILRARAPQRMPCVLKLVDKLILGETDVDFILISMELLSWVLLKIQLAHPNVPIILEVGLLRMR